MEEHYCDVRIYMGDPNCKFCAGAVLNENCPSCRIGCFSVAQFRNPFYNPNGLEKGVLYNYAEWLCAEHYDEVVEFKKRYEDDDLEPWETAVAEDEEWNDDED